MDSLTFVAFADITGKKGREETTNAELLPRTAGERRHIDKLTVGKGWDRDGHRHQKSDRVRETDGNIERRKQRTIS